MPTSDVVGPQSPSLGESAIPSLELAGSTQWLCVDFRAYPCDRTHATHSCNELIDRAKFRDAARAVKTRSCLPQHRKLGEHRLSQHLRSGVTMTLRLTPDCNAASLISRRQFPGTI